MAVYSLDVDGLAVDKELGVFDLDFSESDVVAQGFNCFAGRISQCKDDLIEVGRFGSPLGGVAQLDGGSD